MIYYPVAAVVLTIRLEEFGGELPASVVSTLGGAFGIAPLVEGGATDAKTIDIPLSPLRMSIRKNSYRVPDDCSLTLRWQDMPIDAELIRAAAVRCYIGTMTDADAAKRWREGVLPAGMAVNIIKDKWIRFVGFADEGTTSWGDGGDTVSFSCRDHTQMLADVPVPSDAWKSIPWSEPIDRVALALLDSLPATKGMPLHLVGFGVGDIPTQWSRKDTAGGAAGATRGPKIAEETYWDVLTDLAVQHGLIVYADVSPYLGVGMPAGAARIVLARPIDPLVPGPRTVQDARAYLMGSEPTFLDRKRKDADGNIMEWPALVFGHNLGSFSRTKKLGRIKAPTVELVCADGPRRLTARWPENKRATAVDPWGRYALEEVRQIPVRGYRDPSALLVAAQQVFSEIAMQDIEVSWATDELASLGGSNSDPDVLDLAIGSPVRFMFRQTEGPGEVTTLTYHQASEVRLAKWLEERGVEKTAAKAAAKQIAAAKDQQINEMYVREITHEWDGEGDGGYSCSGSAVNYQVARVQQEVVKGYGQAEVAVA